MTTRERYLAAAGTAAAVFALYHVTLSPSVAMWDAGEYIAAAKSLGIPHQPGNPLFVLVAHLAGMLPVAPDYASRINVLAALCGAVTAGLWFLCAERLLRPTISPTGARLMLSAVAALLGATAFTVWNQSVVMEKVYPLSLVGVSLTSWLVLCWLDATHERRADRLLVLIVYIIGLGYAVHPAGLLPAPAVAIAVLRHRPRSLLRFRFMGVLLAAVVFGASPFAFIPVRAAHQPYINVSAVSACEDGAIRADCTFAPETARRLVGTIQREQYGGNPVLERRAPFVAQVQMFWQYFKWQWFRDLEERVPLAQSLIAATMLVLGVLGLISLGQLHRAAGTPGTENQPPPQARGGGLERGFWYFAPLAASFTVALIFYLNFRYGATQSPELGDLVSREPRDRDYFYMWTFSLWGLLAAIGLSRIAFGAGPGSGRASTALRFAALAGFAIVPLVSNYSTASRAGQSFTRDYAIDMLNSLEPNSVIVTNGDNDSFPLWYAQAVEGVRRDVTVMLTPYLGMDWYARQLNRRDSVWKLSDQELDTMPPYLELPRPFRFVHGAITADMQPGYLFRDQLLVLRAIKDSFPGRPIYFSLGPYPRRLGLDPYLKRVGLVQKLEAEPVREGPDTVRTPSGAIVDVARSLALWRGYRGARQVVRQGQWVDRPTVHVPLYYAAIGQELAIALDARGDHAAAREVADLVNKVAVAVQ